MPTLLDDPPGALTENAPGKTPDGAAPEAKAAAAEPRECANCGAPLQEGQGWCLQCGTASPGSLDGGRHSWRSLGVVLGVLAALIAGAATAAYAALNSQPARSHRIVRVTPVPAAAVPPATPRAATPPLTPPKIGNPTTIAPAPAVPAPATPPKIPLATSSPKPAPSTPPSTANTTPTETTPKETPPAPTPASPAPPAALLLDTNAASTYNPNGYPASRFGDPSLTIDGDRSTAWSAQVDPAIAPRMAAGLAIDLRSAHRLSTLELITSTPGMTVQVYGANTSSLPTSISNPAWVALSGPNTASNRHTKIKLDKSTTPFRFVTLWISSAPAASVGTAQAPGSVDVNEIELFPPQ